MRRAELSESVTPHVLRHTFCLFLVMAGTPMATVKELMGHSDISTSMIYTHLSGRHKSDSVELLPF